MNKSNESRRDFIKKTAGVSAGLVVGGVLPGFSASSYKRILGANEMLRVSVMGVNSVEMHWQRTSLFRKIVR